MTHKDRARAMGINYRTYLMRLRRGIPLDQPVEPVRPPIGPLEYRIFPTTPSNPLRVMVP